jgi:hypothetical protein
MPEPFRVDITPSEQVTAIVYPAAARVDAGISLILAHKTRSRSGAPTKDATAVISASSICIRM